MAKRKTHKKTTHHRRRKMGAVALNKDLLTQAAGALGGYVIGQMVASKIAPNMDNKIKGAILAAGGVFLVPMVMKNTLGRGLSIGLAVAGGQKILQGFNIISGSSHPVMLMPAGNGRMGVRQLSGNGVNAMVNGIGDGVNAMVNGRRAVSGRSAMQTALKYG